MMKHSRYSQRPYRWELKEALARLRRIKSGELHESVYHHDEDMSSGDRWHKDHQIVTREYPHTHKE